MFKSTNTVWVKCGILPKKIIGKFYSSVTVSLWKIALSNIGNVKTLEQKYAFKMTKSRNLVIFLGNAFNFLNQLSLQQVKWISLEILLTIV